MYLLDKTGQGVEIVGEVVAGRGLLALDEYVKGSSMIILSLRGLIFLSLLCAPCITYASDPYVQNDPNWQWQSVSDGSYGTVELDSLIALHKQWLNDRSARQKENRWNDSRRLNLTGAVLRDVILDAAPLNLAILDSTNLRSATLRQSNLSHSSLRYADLYGANLETVISLESADFTGARLQKTTLRSKNAKFANFARAELVQADLYRTDFTGSVLRNTNLLGATLTEAKFAGADLHYVRYETIEGQPDIPGISQALGLRALKYETDPGSLISLRAALAERGFRQQEREVICALKRHDQNWLERLAFDWSSEWGSNLYRPWFIVSLLWLVCALSYYVIIWTGRLSGIRLVIPMTPTVAMGVIGRGLVRPEQHGSSQSRCTVKMDDQFFWLYNGSTYSRVPKWLRLAWWVCFFSTMNTFNIGFRDINFGRWLKLLTRREFDLQATGFARVVSGIQALLSVYLVALWALSFAGNPFF